MNDSIKHLPVFVASEVIYDPSTQVFWMPLNDGQTSGLIGRVGLTAEFVTGLATGMQLAAGLQEG